MDGRIRALLEPKAFARDKKAAKEVVGDPSNSTSQASQSNTKKQARSRGDSATYAVPIYDPRKLLDPKRTRKSMAESGISDPSQQTHESRSPSSLATVEVSQIHPDTAGSKSMIEDLYGVQRRTDRPTKRMKLDSDEYRDKPKGKGGARTHHSSGVVGEYMRPGSDGLDQTIHPDKVVDLTSIDDIVESDDELKVVKARNVSNEQEVCFGRLTISVHAHAVPKPRKMTSLYGESNQFPITKCVALRNPSKNAVIELKDPHDFIFGRIEPDVANVLAPLMDGLKKFRLEVWLNPRKRKPNDWPHQPCSETLVANVNVYGRKADVEKVGKLLGQRNIWLKAPSMVEHGFETVNPHVDRFKSMFPPGRSTGKNSSYTETRTVEEATEAVSRLFDHHADTTKALPETDSGPMILTPLLSHQKQCLTFMLQREQPRTYGETESENSSLWRKKHKANGVTFYEEIVTGITLKEEPEEVFGGLLADVMGLGKTIEALSLITSTLDDARAYGRQKVTRADASDVVLLTQSKATLIVAPVSTVKNWEDQINEHVESSSLRFYTYHGSNRERSPFKLAEYDIVISTYSTIAAECSAKSHDSSPIRATRWFRIILDEAHTIRESRASQSQAMYSLLAQRRWCLTGTPIQNRLDDLGSLTKFLRLYPYDTTMRFNQYVRSPAQSGDANYLKSLRVFIDSFTLRRLKDRVDLPARKDLVERLCFSAEERRLHTFFKERASVQIQDMAGERKHRTVSQHHVLRAIMTLRLICDHGRELLKEDDLEAVKGNSQNDAINIDAETETESKPRTITFRDAHDTFMLLAEADLDMCRQCDKRISGDTPHMDTDIIDDVRGYMMPCYDILCPDCFEYHRDVIDSTIQGQVLECPLCQANVAAQYIPIPKAIAELLDRVPEETPNETEEAFRKGNYTGPSTKVKALLNDLNEIQEESKTLEMNGEQPLKSVIFSEFTSNLDLIERGLDAAGFENSHVRIDGSMSLNKRKTVLDRLNDDNSITILLASIKAAGQGLNLTAASRAFIMEPMWNPAAESQAVDRIYRIGQKRNVVIKRYQLEDSIEGKIIELQRKKQALADISMNKNHKLLNKKESREQSMKEILALFK